MHNSWDFATSFSAILIYTVAAVLLSLRLKKAKTGLKLERAPKYMMVGLLGTSLHAMSLFGAVLTGFGLNLSFFYSLSLTAWLAGLMLPIAALSKPVENLGIVIYPLAALFLLLQYLFHTEPAHMQAYTLALQTHILLSLFAYSVLAIASVQAILLHIQDSHLRHKHPGGFIRALPSLTTMETLLFEMILLGFLLLSLALLSGFMFIDDLFKQHLAHKTFFSLFAWIVFAILLFGRYRFGWRGTTAITWTVAGFACLVLAYFGSKLALEIILKR